MRIERENTGNRLLSGGSPNTRPLVGNTGGAWPCVRVVNHPAQSRASAGRGEMKLSWNVKGYLKRVIGKTGLPKAIRVKGHRANHKPKLFKVKKK